MPPSKTAGISDELNTDHTRLSNVESSELQTSSPPRSSTQRGAAKKRRTTLQLVSKDNNRRKISLSSGKLSLGINSSLKAGGPRSDSMKSLPRSRISSMDPSRSHTSNDRDYNPRKLASLDAQTQQVMSSSTSDLALTGRATQLPGPGNPSVVSLVTALPCVSSSCMPLRWITYPFLKRTRGASTGSDTATQNALDRQGRTDTSTSERSSRSSAPLLNPTASLRSATGGLTLQSIGEDESFDLDCQRCTSPDTENASACEGSCKGTDAKHGLTPGVAHVVSFSTILSLCCGS